LSQKKQIGWDDAKSRFEAQGLWQKTGLGGTVDVPAIGQMISLEPQHHWLVTR
jgi:hypothetical protein